MKPERILTDGLATAARHAPAWDDSMLEGVRTQSPPSTRRRSRSAAWTTVAASLAVIFGLSIAAGWFPGSSGRSATPAPLAPPIPATAGRSPSPSRGTTVSPPPLLGTTWVADRMHRPLAAVPLARRPWLRLDPDGALTGHDGCTSITGRHQVADGRISLTELVTGAPACTSGYPGQGFLDALKQSSHYVVHGSTLTLSEASGLGALTMHALTVTTETAPTEVLLRVTNNTPRAITRIQVLTPGGPLTFGPLQPGQTSSYQRTNGKLYTYAGLETTYADGRTLTQIPTDYVGEEPLGPGRYHYLLADQDTGHDPPYLNIRFEESGAPAPGG